MDIAIRPAQLADAPALAALSGQLGYPCDAATMQDRLAAIQAAGQDEAFVAAIGESVLGWMQVCRVMRLESGGSAEITGLVVDSRARGGGCGRLLVEAARAWAQAQGLPRLVVRMNVVRTETRSFYTRMGFVEKKQQIVWEAQ